MTLDSVHWEISNSITLNLTVLPIPKNGQFKIYRKCLSEAHSEEKFVGNFGLTIKPHRFPDSDPALKNPYIYRYRVVYSLDSNCNRVKETNGRAIEDDDGK